MQLKALKSVEGDNTYQFPVDGRNTKEVNTAKSKGYMELPRFRGAGDKCRTDGYFCGACKALKKAEFTMTEHPSTHDGYCDKYNFRVRDYGCCGGYEPKTGLFSYNP